MRLFARTIDPLLSQFGADRKSEQQAYRSFVLEKSPTRKIFSIRAVAQIYLGTASWTDRVQALVDDIERSEEPRAGPPERPGP